MMERVLVYGMTNNRGGIESYLMNYFTAMVKRGNIIFDFVTDYSEIAYKERIESLNGKIYFIPSRRGNLLKHMQQLRAIVRKNEYKYIYFNILSASEVFTVASVWGMPGKKIVVHSHNNSVKTIKRHKMLRPLLNVIADIKLSCSVSAAEFMFGKSKLKQVQIIHNAIFIDKYIYSDSIRRKTREEMNLCKEFVVGHIGRLFYQKNTLFLLDIFSELVKKNQNSVLLIAGDGEDRELVEENIRKKKLEDKVKLLGMRDDIPRLLQAFDVFVLPSRFEGLPVVAIEAQAAGLHCFCSNKITKDVDITGNVKFIDLERTAEDWSDAILSHRKYQRKLLSEELNKAGYGIENQVIVLEEVFSE